MPHKLVFSFTWYRFIAACSCYCWYIFCDSTLFGWIEEALIVWFTLIKLRTMRSNERIVTQQKEEAPKHWVCVYPAQPETQTGECVYGARRKRVTTSLYESQFGIKHKSKSNLLGKWFFCMGFFSRGFVIGVQPAHSIFVHFPSTFWAGTLFSSSSYYTKYVWLALNCQLLSLWLTNVSTPIHNQYVHVYIIKCVAYQKFCYHRHFHTKADCQLFGCHPISLLAHHISDRHRT